MLSARVGWMALGLILIVLVGWPVLAMLLYAARHAGPVGAGSLLDAALVSSAGRPFGLALATFRVTAGALMLALAGGTVLAFLLFRTDLWGGRAVLALVLLTLFVPLPLHALAWLNALGNVGRAQAIGGRPLLTGWPGAAVIHALAVLPWVVLLYGVGVRAVERELEEAAWLDRPAWRVALRVTWRRALGALAAAALVAAVLTAGDMTVTDLLQVRTYAEESYVQSQLGEGPAAAAKVALPPLIVLGGLIALGVRVLLRIDPERVATVAAQPRIWRLGAWRRPLGLLVMVIAGGLLAVPLYGLICAPAGWEARRRADNRRAGACTVWPGRSSAPGPI